MRRLEVRVLPPALDDLDEIFRAIASKAAEPVVATRFIDRLLTAIDRIGNAPHGGRTRDDLLPGLRTWSFERRATITYLIRTDAVVVTNIFYGGRDIAAFYSRPSERSESQT